MTLNNRHLYQFGPFLLDSRQRRLLKDGIPVSVAPKGIDLLIFMVERHDQVVTKDDLIQNIWPDSFVEEANLSQNIFLLRKALGEKAQENRYIATVPGRGYRFVAEVHVVDSPQNTRRESAEADQAARMTGVVPAPVQLTVPPNIPPAPRRGMGATWIVVSLTLAVAALAFAGWWHWFGAVNKTATVSSLAVLPLENLTGDSSQEYFVEGMTDALITNLAQIGALRVISHTSVEQYKGTRRPLPQIARELNVDAVVEGTVARSGNRVRVDAQLIQAATDEHLWAKSYEGSLIDVLALQNDISRNIADEIKVRLLPRERARLALTPSVKPEAYEAYLKGRYFWSKRTTDNLRISIEYYQLAIAEDPTFAAAYAGLADTYSIVGSSVMPASVASEKARAAALKALELDPSLAEGHAALALVHFYYDWNWSEAERECRRAIELNPNYATAHSWYSLYLGAMGRNPEALSEAQRARELDPLSLSVGIRLASAYRDTHQDERALEELGKTLELDPNFASAHRTRGRIYEDMGQRKQALEEYKKAADFSHDPTSLAALAHFYATNGGRGEAGKIVRQLLSEHGEDYVSPYEIAPILVALGEKNQALSLLEQAFQQHDSRMPFLAVDGWLAPLHSDPRFVTLEKKVGLGGG
jgi:TolB-like protein/DNA-binding winged helix-turn-helix (wHTH) protein/Flp pilus assembly protein TadD